MEMFALDAEVTQWESALLPLRGAERLPVQVALAWHLRQRDSKRAAMLAAEALNLLLLAQLEPAANQVIAARLHLVQGESQWLQGELDAAEALARAALDQAGIGGDAAACADAHWLLAWVAADRGEHARGDAELEQAAAAAREADDHVRLSVTEAALARWAVLRDPQAAIARWGRHFSANLAQLPAPVATWVNDFLGLAASLSSDFGAAAAYFIHCYEAALETGQLRAAITAATNIGKDFSKLNDHHAALEWMQCALDLARPSGWPVSIGSCLMHTADTMRRLGRLDAAQALLQEALDILAPLTGARSFAGALQYLGDLALDQGDYGGALDAFERLELRARVLNQSDFQCVAWRGQAHALAHLNRVQEALQTAQESADLAARQGHAAHQIAALRVLAMIHSRHRVAPPGLMTQPTAALHYLHQALALAATIDGYTVPGDLLDALACEYAQMGSFAQAYDIVQAASAAREKTHSQEATNRAIAMQVHHQTEHARAEGYHHRQLAASEARRAEVLQQTSAMLERLAAIGQEITTHLDAGAVFQTLERHVHALLPASQLAIYLTDPAGATLNRAFGVEAGQTLTSNSIPLSQPHANSVRCLVERREVLVEHLPDQESSAVGSAPLTCLSSLYVPLLIGERALGDGTGPACASLRRARTPDFPHPVYLWRDRARQRQRLPSIAGCANPIGRTRKAGRTGRPDGRRGP